jgi:hypothetical protein
VEQIELQVVRFGLERFAVTADLGQVGCLEFQGKLHQYRAKEVQKRAEQRAHTNVAELNHEQIALNPFTPHDPLRSSCLLDPEQALAVFEFLEDLKELIGNHYSAQLFEDARKQYALNATLTGPTHRRAEDL